MFGWRKSHGHGWSVQSLTEHADNGVDVQARFVVQLLSKSSICAPKTFPCLSYPLYIIMSSSEPEFEQTPLLKSLRRDLSGKRTVLDCLRSKAIPRPEVKKALTGNIEKQDLRFSKLSLLGALGGLKVEALKSEGDLKPSLWFITRLATALNFIQLLLEYGVLSNDENSHSHDGSEKKNTEEILAWAGHVLDGLVGLVCSCNEKHAKESRDDGNPICNQISESFQTSHITCFVFGSVLRLTSYISSHVGLLIVLYRALGSIAASSRILPAELLDEAIQGLVFHLQEGVGAVIPAFINDWTTDECSTGNAQSSLHLKVLSFIVGRLELFLSIDTGDYAALDCSKVFSYLTTLHGLVRAAKCTLTEGNDGGRNESLAKRYEAITVKCGSVVMTSIIKPCEDVDRHISPSFLESLLHAKIGADLTVDEVVSSTAVASFQLGKISVLVKVLERSLEVSSLSGDDVDSLLRIVEALMFVELPGSYRFLVNNSFVPVKLLSQTMSLISTTLLTCECFAQSVAVNADPGRRRFHHKLLSWLAASHPLSVELVLTTLQSHCSGLHEWHGVDAAEPLIFFALKLLFFPKTKLGLRSRIASLILRVLKNSSDEMHSVAENLLMDETICLERSLRPKSKPNKRKRSAPAKLGCQDLEIVIGVISSLTKHVELDGGAPSFWPVDSTQAKYVEYSALRVALLGVSIRSGRNASQGLEALFARLNRLLDENNARFSFLKACSVNLMGTACRNATVTKEQFFTLCSFLHQDSKTTVWNEHSTLFDQIVLLGDVGTVYETSSTESSSEKIAKTFSNLLSSGLWPVRTFAMSRLTWFARSIPTNCHERILPMCVPDERRPFLVARVNHKAVLDPEKLSEVKALYCQFVDRVINFPQRSRKFFTVSESKVISSGSYLMTMATQGGRQAIVIFPPGPQSLVEITYMLGGEAAEQQPDVLTVERAVALPDGSCKLFLQGKDSHQL